MEPKIFSVGQINRYIKNLFENDFILNSLFVKGEISNFKAHSSGHFYFTLKDQGGAIACVMFKRDASAVPFEIENGMSVVLYGHISLYEKTGQYQLYVEMIDPVGIGALQLAYDQLKQRLKQEGLFDEDFKRELPKTINTIAVITSPTGAAVRDIIKIAKRRDRRVRLAVIPTLVQGENAAEDIVDSLRIANEWGKADVIILGRGGGSIEDMWAFNEERVARAVFASEIPVISAVGHETDFTICDLVADVRASTPSAAAEIATVPLEDSIDRLNLLERAMTGCVTDILEQGRRRLRFVQTRPVLMRPTERIENNRLYLERIMDELNKNTDHRLAFISQRLANTEGRLSAASPLRIMERGYVLAEDEGGRAVVSASGVNKEDILFIRMRDGMIKTKVLEKVMNSRGKEKDGI